MSRDRSTIEIGKKRYNRDNLAMLLGLENESDLDNIMKMDAVPSDILNIAWVLDKPTRLPVALKDIYAIERDDNEGVRLALARAQIDAALNLNENLQKYTKQKFVAETIEKMLFGELLLEGKSKKNSSGGNGNNNAAKRSQNKASPKKGKTSGKKQTSKKK